MNEAKASMNFFGVTQAGWNVQFTLRADDEKEMMERFGAFVKLLNDCHVTPKPVGQQPSQQPSQQAPQLAPMAPAVPAPTQTQPAQSLTFQASSLVGSLLDGKAYWKVRGGKFGKYGVTIWPEVLEAAGFSVGQLNPANAYDLNGYTAEYIMDGTKPDKVIALTR